MARPDIRRVDLTNLSPEDLVLLTRRAAVPDRSIREAATAIVEAVRNGGDAALTTASARYGGGTASGDISVPPAVAAAALERLEPDVRAGLRAAVTAIASCHEPQLPTSHIVETAPGVRVERRWAPLRRVGVYAPGGRAPYPSSLLMGAVPARLAGVPEVVVATPAGPDGRVADVSLAAAALAGATEIYAVGGAQAVGALAYGTETIAPVDKIVGPGNAWVTAAKLAVSADVAVDLPAGPSEALILCDGSTPARLAAADMICQAEHGPDSPVVLVTPHPDIVPDVLAAVADLLPGLERREIIAKALTDHGLVVTAPTLEAAVSFADDYAPEHLSLHLSDPERHLDRLTSAGSIFVGRWAPESAGDYATGANHVLPTGGRARAHGPLGIDDFGSWRQIQRLSEAGLRRLLPTIAALAGAEGLTAHRLAAEIRFEEGARP